MNPVEQFKQSQREMWSSFAPIENATMLPAVQLARYADVRPGQAVLDVGCGTGVVALAARRQGGKVTGLDLTPELIERAKQHAELSRFDDITWKVGDAEELPFPDASFDVVVSQFGHMFAPRPEVAAREMLRVLKPGGTIAFSTWPPDSFPGRLFALVGSFAGPPPAGISPPAQWGDPNTVRERLPGVGDLHFRHQVMTFPTLSPQHWRHNTEQTLGPVRKLATALQQDAQRLATFRSELERLATEFFEDHSIRHEYLMTRGVKRAR